MTKCDNCRVRKELARKFDIHWLGEDDCPYAKCQVTTNADRIRAMTDDELADFFDRAMETFNPWCDGPCPEDAICRSCVVEWLKEEAKGETDEGN